MIPGTRGVKIPIYLVSSAMDSIWKRIVLFKPVPLLTSDLKSEFLCQSSLCCAELADLPLNTSYTWDNSHALITMYHPCCHGPSALTEYLKQKLCIQRAKCLGRSPSAQVEQNVPLKCNITQTPHPHKLLRWGRCVVVVLIGIQLGIDRVFTSKHCFFCYYHDLIQTVTAHVKIQSIVMECEHQECLTCQEGQAPFP